MADDARCRRCRRARPARPAATAFCGAPLRPPAGGAAGAACAGRVLEGDGAGVERGSMTAGLVAARSYRSSRWSGRDSVMGSGCRWSRLDDTGTERRRPGSTLARSTIRIAAPATSQRSRVVSPRRCHRPLSSESRLVTRQAPPTSPASTDRTRVPRWPREASTPRGEDRRGDQGEVPRTGEHPVELGPGRSAEGEHRRAGGRGRRDPQGRTGATTDGRAERPGVGPHPDREGEEPRRSSPPGWARRWRRAR